MSFQDKVQNGVSQLDKEVCAQTTPPMFVFETVQADPTTAFQVSRSCQPREAGRYVFPSAYGRPILICSGVPKVYFIGGIAFVYFFLIFLNYGGQLLTNVAGFIIPGYYSLNALFTASRVDDTQWLTYVPLRGISVLFIAPFSFARD